MLIYIASFFVRYNGQKIESSVWNSWNGAPSTRFMRWSDQTFGNELKRKLHRTVKLSCDIDLKSKGEELNDPLAADKKIIQAFSEVRAIVRLKDPNVVWLIQNAEYGFHRNLYGSRWAWLILSSLGILVCSYAWSMWKSDTILLGVVLNNISFLAAILFEWYYIPKFMYWAANRYAESLWTTFLVLAEKKQSGK